EQTLQESEARFRSLSASSPIGIFHCDAAGHNLYTNARWQEITGFTLEQSLGDGWVNAIHPDDRAAVLAEWQQCAHAGREFSFEFRFLRPDGEARWVHSRAVAIHSASGIVVGYVGTHEDITDRKRIEAALTQERDLLQALMDNLPDMIYFKDTASRFT